MSADLYTTIKATGTPEQIKHFLEGTIALSEKMNNQYATKHDCAYFDIYEISSVDGKQIDEDTLEEDLKKCETDSCGKITIDISISGPWGIFGVLSDSCIYEQIATQEPEIELTGETSGFITGADVKMEFEQKDGIMTMDEYYREDGENYNAYLTYIKKILPFKNFLSRFKVKNPDLTEEEYDDFLMDQFAWSFPDIPFNAFLEAVGSSDLKPEEYFKLIAKLQEKTVVGMDDFMTFHFKEEPIQTFVFDARKGEFL